MQNLEIAVSLQKRNNFMFKWYMIFRLSENKSAVIKIGLIQNSEVRTILKTFTARVLNGNIIWLSTTSLFL